jgi:phosphatidylinositol phospholipase C delta
MHSDLSSLISVHNVKFKGLEHEFLDAKISPSLSDKKFHKMLKKYGNQSWRLFNKDHVTRIYPQGTHVTSSNYDPQDMWAAGCQIVALNFQGSSITNNRQMWINDGKFRGNGGSGYVPKPPHMLPRIEGTSTDSQIISPTGEPHSATFSVTVVEGVGWDCFKDADTTFWDFLQLRGGADSYVQVEIAGAECDRACKKTKTFTSKHRTGPKAQPFWDESFTFSVQDVDLAIVLFTVWDEDEDFDDLLGQYAFPLADLRAGVRRVPLLDSKGVKQTGDPSLLCSFNLARQYLVTSL